MTTREQAESDWREHRRAREAEFLEGLTALSMRTGVVVVGCGCCDSPWLAMAWPIVGSYSVFGDDGGNLSWREPPDAHGKPEVRS